MDNKALSTHPEAAALAAYYDDALTDDERAEVEDHLLECTDCLRDLAWLRESLAVHPVEQAPREVVDRVKRLMAGKAEPADKPRAPAHSLGKLFVERLSGLHAQLVFRPSFASAAELFVPAWAAPAAARSDSPPPAAAPSPGAAPPIASPPPGAAPLRRSTPPPPAAAPPLSFSAPRELTREAPRSYSRARQSAPRARGSSTAEVEAGHLRLILAVHRTRHEDRLHVTVLQTDTQRPEEHLAVALCSPAGDALRLETDAAGMVSFPLTDETSQLTIEGEAPVVLEISVV